MLLGGGGAEKSQSAFAATAKDGALYYQLRMVLGSARRHWYQTAPCWTGDDGGFVAEIAVWPPQASDAGSPAFPPDRALAGWLGGAIPGQKRGLAGERTRTNRAHRRVCPPGWVPDLAAVLVARVVARGPFELM